jgi:hypothetical protein
MKVIKKVVYKISSIRKKKRKLIELSKKYLPYKSTNLCIKNVLTVPKQYH